MNGLDEGGEETGRGVHTLESGHALALFLVKESGHGSVVLLVKGAELDVGEFPADLGDQVRDQSRRLESVD